MKTDPISPANQVGSQSKSTSTRSALEGVNLDDFLKLMITELQNQDPLNPMDNAQILEQISQIRSVESTTKLTSTLDSVLLGQGLSNAGTLINKQIRALGDDGKEVSGRVDKVTIDKGIPKLIVGGKSVGLGNLKEILPSSN